MKRKLFESQARIKGQEEDSRFLKRQMEVEKAKAEHEREIKLQKIKVEDELNNLILQQELNIDRIQKDHDLERLKKKMDLEGTMSDVNMQKYMADTTMEIYKKLPLKNVDVHNYVGAGARGGSDESGWVGAGGGLGIEQLLPALNNFSASCKTKVDAAK